MCFSSSESRRAVTLENLAINTLWGSLNKIGIGHDDCDGRCNEGERGKIKREKGRERN